MSLAIAQTADNMRAFPPAEKGMTHHVIRLPQEKDEAALKVEVIVGANQNWVCPAPLAHRRRYEGYLLPAVRPGVVCPRDEALDRPALDLDVDARRGGFPGSSVDVLCHCHLKHY